MTQQMTWVTSLPANALLSLSLKEDKATRLVMDRQWSDVIELINLREWMELGLMKLFCE